MRRGNAILEFHQAWNEAERLNQTVTLTCGNCGDFEVTECLFFARREHRDHRAQHHPEAVSSRRAKRRHTLSLVINGSSLEDNIAGARLQGAAGWAGPE